MQNELKTFLEEEQENIAYTVGEIPANAFYSEQARVLQDWLKIHDSKVIQRLVEIIRKQINDKEQKEILLWTDTETREFTTGYVDLDDIEMLLNNLTI